MIEMVFKHSRIAALSQSTAPNLVSEGLLSRFSSPNLLPLHPVCDEFRVQVTEVCYRMTFGIFHTTLSISLEEAKRMQRRPAAIALVSLLFLSALTISTGFQ